MTPQTPAAIELRDIHLPDPVSFWPPAAGWWLLLLLIIGIILAHKYLLPKIIKKMKHQTARKLAVTEFNVIQKNYLTDKNKSALIQTLSVLLRRIAMTYQTRNNSAGLTGQQWIKHLHNINPGNPLPDEFSQLLISAPYQKQVEFDAQKILKISESWIQQLPKEPVP